MNKLNLPENIIRLRRERKLTQEELADFMGVTKASVSKWEKGINTPDLLLLPQLAGFFDVTVDELIGYEAQLSPEQIRRQYSELCRDFAARPFSQAMEKVRALAHKYCACYPLLLQLSILCWNHYMLADGPDEQKQILREAEGWCGRIMENSKDVGLCGDALVLQAGLRIHLGEAAGAIEVLEPSADPTRLAWQNGTLLIQAYQQAGDLEKAKSYAQAKHYLDLVGLLGDAVMALSQDIGDMGRCEETIRRVRGVIELYKLESLNPNAAAQFYFQSALVYAAAGEDEKAMDELLRVEKCITELFSKGEIILHGDEYFDLLDAWIERLPLGNMAPRDKSFILPGLIAAFDHPAFERMREKDGFQHLIKRLRSA